jgi:hypothetical protein
MQRKILSSPVRPESYSQGKGVWRDPHLMPQIHQLPSRSPEHDHQQCKGFLGTGSTNSSARNQCLQ